MQSTDDGVLLRQYAENHSDEAFAVLVTRHINLVYSVAVRCVGDPHQAEEVAQAVFILLAKKAAHLRHDKALASWLFQTTRLTASNFVRGETRRHRREQEAHMQSVLDDSGNDVWPRIAPLLDDAVAGLSEKDRHAIVLRFYEGRNLREVGAALGASEEAAEKRVHRAVERLREFFAKRGVTVGASGLGVVISANAVQVAPVGLAVTISTASALGGTFLTTTATTTATKAIAMTVTQKVLITAVLAAVVGTGIYEARRASTLRSEVQSLQQQQGTLAEQIDQMSRDRDDAANRLALLVDQMERSRGNPAELLKLRGEVTRLRSDSQELAQLKAGDGTNDFAERELRLWVGRVKKLRQFSDENPSLQIPEFKLLTEQDWLDEAREKTKANMKKTQLNTPKDLERAMGNMRMKAKSNFGMLAGLALREYLGANSAFPVGLSQLKPHFKTALEDDILERYTIERGRTVGTTRGWEWVITDKPLASEPYQEHIIIGPTGLEWGPRQGPSTADPELAATKVALEPLTKEYSAANNGKEPTDPLQLQPFVKTPEQEAAFRKLIEKRNPIRKDP